MGSGHLHVRPPAGKQQIVFRARRVKTRENRGVYQPEPLAISIGALKAEEIIAGETEVEIRIPLPAAAAGAGGEPVRVEFRGTGDIGITTMSFE